MSLETDVEKTPQTQTTPTPSPRPLAPKESERNRNIHSIILVCSLALAGCFFLPWIKFLFGTPSGYDLQQLPSDEAKLLGTLLTCKFYVDSRYLETLGNAIANSKS
jgi:hypothetical protein